MMQIRLSCDYPQSLGEEEEEELQGSREAFLKITVNFLRRLKQEGLADHLEGGEEAPLRILDLVFLLFSGTALRVSRLSRKPSRSLSAPTQIHLEDKVPESV